MNDPDGGVDAALPDSGINGTCPTNAAALGDINPDNGQDVVIARVVFLANGGATVTLANLGTLPFNFGDASFLCSGANDTCLDVSDIDDLAAGAEISRFLDDTAADEGELALLSSNLEDVIAYVAWGDGYESNGVSGLDDAGLSDPLEELAIADGRWTDAERITVGAAENAIFGDGDTDTAVGFTACTGDDF